MAQAVSLPQTRAARNPSPRRDLAEIAIAWGLIMAVIWTPRPIQRYLWIAAAAAVIILTWNSFDSAAAIGLRATNFLRSLWIVAAALLLAGIAIFAAARFGTLRMPAGVLAFIATYCAYAIWSGVQQFLLQGFFLLRLLRLMPNQRAAALAATTLFAVAHIPNPILAPLTFVWGFAACLLFLRYRNLYTLAIAHAILGITIAMTVPGPVDHNMRVGLSYLAYSRHRNGHTPYPLQRPLPKP